MFRVIESYRPTLLVDEADTFLRDNDELRGIINSGHRRGGAVLRTVGDDHEPRAFSTYAPCAIALIGKLPDTLHDRSVVVGLKRRLPNEPITPFRPDRAGHLDILARQAARWGRDHADQLETMDPDMPSGIYNREADNWRPLLAIAQVADGHWPERTRKAVVESHDAAGDDESRITVLLADIRDIFAQRVKEGEIAKDAKAVLPSSKLADELAAIEGRPWAEYGKARKPISQNQVARLLRPLGIAPETARTGKKIVRTYQLHQFADAFERYLSPEGALQPQHCNKCDEIRTSGPSPSATQGPNVAVAECEKSSNDGLCCGVAVEKGVEGRIGEGGTSPEAVPLVCEHCGNPETADQPVLEFNVESVRCLLHPDCEQEWLGAIAQSADE
jgi:hypothetical protein